MEIKIGDWVRFMQDGRLVIGKVEYIKSKLLKPEYFTDAGVVDFDRILEVRSDGDSHA